MDIRSDTPHHSIDLDAFDVHASLRRLREAVRNRFQIVVTTVVVAFCLVFLYVKLFPPIYKAEVMVVGEAQEDTARTSYYAFWDVFRKGDLKSEPTLMTSRSVAEKVVDGLHLKFSDVHHSFLTHVGYLWTESLVGKAYRKVKQWLFPPEASDYQPTDEEIDRARTIEAFKESIALEPVGNSTVGRFVVRAPSYRVAEFANKSIDAYLALRRQASSQEAEDAYQSLKAELEKVAAALGEVENEKLEFDRTNKLTVEFERDKVLLGKWGDLRSALAELDAQNAGIRASLAAVEKSLAKEPPEVVSVRTLQGSRVRTMLETREFELRTTLQGLEERYRDDSPEVLETKRLLDETRDGLSKEPEQSEAMQNRILNPAYESLRTQQHTLMTQLAANQAMQSLRKKDFEELNFRMESLPGLFLRAHEIARKREALEGRYKLLNERFMMADVSRSAAVHAPAPVRVVDYASPPMQKSWPDLKLLLPATLAIGTLLGIGLALLADFFSARVTRDRLAARRDLMVYASVSLRTPLGPLADDAAAPAEGPSSALARLRQPVTEQHDARYFAARMTAQAARRLQLENDLRHALAGEQFDLHFQPWLDLATQQVAGYEALLRWNHPQLGNISPGEFITLAEDSGLIIPIGEWVLRAAARQAKDWMADTALPVAINLSARQFNQENLVSVVRQVLEEYDLPPSQLMVDISEGTLVLQSEHTIETLDALGTLGVRVSIDDVGARYSSLAYLERFPVDQIKIGQDFIRDMLDDPADADLVRSIIRFSHDLRIRVVAKGVENEAQMQFLRAARCDDVQGYHLGRPVPVSEISSKACAA